MINLFRHARLRISGARHFKKYLLYAFGEIILVVAGILIALWVNNWNQERKEERSGEILLARIHRDLVQDTLYFRNTIHQNLDLREELKGLLVSLYDGIESMKEVRQMSGIYDRALDQVFAPHDNTYRSMISSGTLNLIRNQELKEEIVDLYSTYEQKGVLLSSIGNWLMNIVASVDAKTNFIKFNNDVSDIFTTDEMFNESDYSFLNDPDSPGFQLLIRAISAAAFNQKVNISHYLELIYKCDQVLSKIDNELREPAFQL